MLRADAKLPNEMLGIVAAALYPLSVHFFGLSGALMVSLVLLLALIVWYVFWMRARIPDVGVSFFGAAYCGMLLSGLVVVRQALPHPWGGVLVLGIFFSVWANDSFAYLVGSKFGKHKLAPRVSPKKSWEGFFAGLVGSALFWCLFTLIPWLNLGIPMAMAFGVISGLCGVLGDLAESRIKRNVGFKDSGKLLPGHGGLLDRCDSLFLVAVASAILLVAGGASPLAGKSNEPTFLQRWLELYSQMIGGFHETHRCSRLHGLHRDANGRRGSAAFRRAGDRRLGGEHARRRYACAGARP